jgi:hypothetical protein
MIAVDIRGEGAAIAPRRSGGGRRRYLARATIPAALAALMAGASACKDSNVPFLTAPTVVPNTPTGVQDAVTGLFSATRLDVGFFITFMSTFARDAANFTNTSPTYITQIMGLSPIDPSGFGLFVWDQEYTNIRLSESIIGGLPAIVPAYTAAGTAAITGVVETMKALNYMMLAETRDTVGIAIQPLSATEPGPLLCAKDAWQYIVALLDSGNADLNAAGATPLPIKLPPGFGAVAGQASPSTAPGAFAAFNRALAGKAGLELAYAIARTTPAAHPTPTSPGAPDPGALTRADSAIAASALFNVAALAPPTAGGFTFDPYGVYHGWSAQSGDQVNPINAEIGTLAVLKELPAAVDTVNDLRWKAKFAPNPIPVQLPAYNQDASAYSYVYYPTVASPIPIVRNEELVLVRAQIQLGLGNLATALVYINDVHQGVGGFATPVAGTDYVTVRDLLLEDQRISTALESSEDRTIALRMYGLAAVADTSWGSQDLHTTILPLPAPEVSGRNGVTTLQCP